MDQNTALKNEIVLVEVGAVVALSIASWLAPKALNFGVWVETLGGAVAIAALSGGVHRVQRLENEARMNRVLKAAQRDMFTSETAAQVYLSQLQQQQTINALLAPQGQDRENETTAQSGVQRASMQPTQQAKGAIAPTIEELNLSEALHYPSILICGPQGSGKTTLARELIRLRSEGGHQIKVLDPHSSGWPYATVGGGMDYGAIELACLEFVGEVKGRYQDIQNGIKQFRKTTTVNEEFTNWATRFDDSKNAVDYLRTTLSDTRKIDMCSVFVSHTKTLEGGLSGAKGLASLRDAACYQIELFAEIDPITTEPRPTGRGKLSRPGMPPIDVHIPLLNPNGGSNVQSDRERLERLILLNQDGSANGGSNVHEPPFSWLDEARTAFIVEAILNGQPKQKSLESILGISKGGSSAWVKASDDWDHLKAELMG